MTKMTYVEAIDLVLNAFDSEAYTEPDVVKEKLEALKTSLANRKSSSKKGQTKAQKENEGIKEIILSTLAESGEKMTVTGLTKCEGLDYSGQKISALLRQLIESGKVEKTMEGKKAYFTLVEGD